MWSKIADFILRFRLFLIIIVGLLTVMMLFFADWKRAYDYAALVPASDPEMQFLQSFRKKYGEDGNILAIGIKDDKIYQLSGFQSFKNLSDEIMTIKGVVQTLSLPRLQYLQKDTSLQQFKFKPIFQQLPDNQNYTQQELDKKITFIKTLKFYEGQIINEKTGATVLLVSIDGKILNTADRERMMSEIVAKGKLFTEKTGITLRYAGLPFVRSTMANQVADEFKLFLVLSLLMTGLVLFVFFRSFSSVFFPVMIIGIIVIWTLGILGMFGYKITLLIALLPPILVVIGIPNCVYMITKYHQEFRKNPNKMQALHKVIKNIGVVSLMTNATTAAGFVTLAYGDIVMMREFGIVAGICIAITYILCLILIPAIFSYLPAPEEKHLKHLDSTMMINVVEKIKNIVEHHRKWIYGVSLLIVVISAVGMMKIKTISFMVDEIPKESQMRKDLAFFEENFRGVMPLEIVVNTGKNKGTRKMQNLVQINEFQQSLDSMGISSPALSMVTFLKAARQAYYNDDVAFYDLPDNRDMPFIFKYLKGEQNKSAMIKSFVDTTGQEMRISLKIADIGSIKMDSIIKQVIQPKIDRIFKNNKDISVKITGTTPLFVKGNKYLIDNLKSTIVLAIALVAFLMSLLFRSFRMILITIISNCIPMLITAGIMGFFGVPLKPSTALIFSIVFGIAVDDAIHYLAKYRQELPLQDFDVRKSVLATILDMGQGMIYTSLVLFFGFVIFVGSDFGGTVALGLLTSTTLILAMITNLVLLPALLYDFDKQTK